MRIFLLSHFILASLFLLLSSIIFSSLQVWNVLLSFLLSLYFARPMSHALKDVETEIPSPYLIKWPLSLAALTLLLAHSLHGLFERKSILYTLLKNNYGDAGFHAALIKILANTTFPWQHPAASFEPLRYSAATNLYNASLDVLGVPLQANLTLVVFLSGLVLLGALYRFGGWFLVTVFLFGGVWKGFEIISFATVVDEHQIKFSNLFTTLWVTQKSWAFALPAMLLMLSYVEKVRENPSAVSIPTHFWIGILWGAMPYLHFHSFVFFSFWIAARLLSARRFSVFWLTFRWAFVPATVLTVWLLDFFKKSGSGSFSKGWMLEGQNPLLFWFNQLGPTLVLLLVCFGCAIWKRRTAEMKLWASAFALFVLLQFVQSAPWAWDHIKLLVWPYLLLVAVSFRIIAKWPVWVQAPLFLILFIPGFNEINRISRLNEEAYQVFDRLAEEKMRTLLKDVPRDAVFAAQPETNHELKLLGRTTLMGHPGHLWSHGIHYQEKTDALKELYTTYPSSELIQKLGVTHLMFGPREKGYFGTQIWPGRGKIKPLSQLGDYEVYALSNLPEYDPHADASEPVEPSGREADDRL